MKKNKESEFMLTLLKSPENELNTTSISKLIGLSPMGALKIARSLEKANLISSRKIGNINIYKIEKNNNSNNYLAFLLSQEAEMSPPYLKALMRDLQKINSAESAVIFGSILRKTDANDLDVLFIVKQKNFKELKKEIDKLNSLNLKQIHAIFQGPGDLSKNINKKDKVVLNAIKGIVALGEREFIKEIQS